MQTSVRTLSCRLCEFALTSGSRHMCTVTNADILQACLRNQCITAMPIQYALKHMANFDLEPFVRELLDALLCQPYRGAILRELDRYFSPARAEADYSNDKAASIDFKKLLAEAIEVQGKLSRVEALRESKFSPARLLSFSLHCCSSPVTAVEVRC